MKGGGLGQLKFGLNCVSVKCCATAAGMGRGHVVLQFGGVGPALVGAPSSTWYVMWALSASLASLVACQTARPPAYKPKDSWGAEDRSHPLVLVQVPRCLRPYILARRTLQRHPDQVPPQYQNPPTLTINRHK